MLAAATPATHPEGSGQGWVPATCVVADISQQMRLAEAAFREFRALPWRAVSCGPGILRQRGFRRGRRGLHPRRTAPPLQVDHDPGKLGRDEIYQLAGYLLPDYPDEYGISRVGLYLSRQGATITWDVDEFLRLLGSAEPPPELRERLRRYLTACRARSRSTDATGSRPPS